MSDAQSEQMNKAYLKAVTAIAGGSFDPKNSLIFPARTGSLSVVAGKCVPFAVTNNEKYAVGATLLQESSVWADRSSGLTYLDELQTYFSYVVPTNADNSPAAADRLKEAQTSQSTTATRFRTLKRQVIRDYNDDPDTSKGSLARWAMDNYPEFGQAQEEMDQKTAAVNKALGDVGGPDAVQIGQIQNRLYALSKLQEITGMTMPTFGGYSLDVPIDYIQKIREGDQTQAPDPPGVVHQALYDMSPQYAGILDQWIAGFPTAGDGTTYTLSSKEGATYDQKESGHSESASTSGWWWFCHKTDRTSSDWTKSTVTSHSSEVNITMSVKNSQIFAVNPSSTWNVPGYRRRFPRVRPDLPASAQGVIETNGMLVGSGIKFTVRLSNEAKKAFDEERKTVQDSHGCYSIFGWIWGWNDSSSSHSETKTDTHSASYDEQKGELTISPTEYAGSATLLALIGNKFTAGA